MKPFNLKEALAGKPIQTKSGRVVKFAAYNPEADNNHKVLGWVDGRFVCSWNIEGTHCINDMVLVMAPTKKSGWLNVYPKVKASLSFVVAELKGDLYDTEDKAKSMATDECVATIFVEWEE